jgi:hypothetical protein
VIPREKGRATNAVLFTDMVGSTELRTRQGEDEVDRFGVEEQHRVASLVAARGGAVVKGLGDGVLAAFAGAADAVDAAVAIQQTSPHPVRVGVSIGDVTWGACLSSKLAALSLFVMPIEERVELCARTLEGLEDHADLAGRQRALSEFWTAINPRYDHPIYARALDELAAVGSAQGVESTWNYILSRAEQLVAMADGVSLRHLVANFHDGDKLSDVSRTYLLNIQGHIATWDGDLARAGLLSRKRRKAERENCATWRSLRTPITPPHSVGSRGTCPRPGRSRTPSEGTSADRSWRRSGSLFNSVVANLLPPGSF